MYGAFCKGMAPCSNNTLSDGPSCLPTHGRAIRLIAACVCTVSLWEVASKCGVSASKCGVSARRQSCCLLTRFTPHFPAQNTYTFNTHRHTYRVTCFQSREGETRIHIYTHTNHTAEGTTEGEQFVTARVRTERAQVVLIWS